MYTKVNLDYITLEPYIDDKTLLLHYNGHYGNYVNKLNKLLKENNFKYNYTEEDLARNIDVIPMKDRGEILFNLGGKLNHDLYFYELSLKGNILPLGTIKTDIDKYFGSYNNFKKEFIKKALELKGSGYTFLVMDDAGKLTIINTSNQDTPYYYGFIPILTLDLWEHAFYIKYTINKSKYINNFFKIIDFKKVNTLYEINKKKYIK